MAEQPIDYEASGVSIAAQDEAIAAFKALVERTHGPEVLAGVGAFGAAYAPDVEGVAQPVLVSSTDGVGTKVRLHARFGTHAWAGRDLVGAVLNDVVCSGARPLFFLDYIACHKVIPAVERELVGGMAKACREAGCALIGGEIAEMGATYNPGEYDLAGFGVGIVDRSKMLGSHLVEAGDVIIGLASSGVHCNGFSLVRRILEDKPDGAWLEPRPELGVNLRDALLSPTRCFAVPMAELSARHPLKAAAHISGGGLIDNVPRVIPDGLCARIERGRIPVPEVFKLLEREGPVARDEMWHVFNMGIGLAVICSPQAAPALLQTCEEHCYNAMVIGDVIRPESGRRFEWID